MQVYRLAQKETEKGRSMTSLKTLQTENGLNTLSGNLVAVGAASGFVNDEAEDLALLHVVETNHPNKAVGILRTTGLNFAQHFLGGGGVKQGQLPHSPVVNLRIRGFIELDRRDIALTKDVSNLLLNLRVCERRQIGHGFVTTLFGKSFHGSLSGCTNG